MSRILVAGDWHADINSAVASLVVAQSLGIDRILHVGDFGIAMDYGTQYAGKPTFEGMVSDAAEATGVDIFVVPGNHENWDLIDQIKADPELDGVPTPEGFLPYYKRIHLTHKTHRWTWEGRTFAALAGAFSVNWRCLARGYSWWPQEVPGAGDLYALGDAPADVFVSHEVPAGVPVLSPFRLREDDERVAEGVRALVAAAVERVRPEVAFAGHWHQRLTHVLPHRRGRTRVEVLDRERTIGNLVVLDLATQAVTPARDAMAASRQGVTGQSS